MFTLDKIIFIVAASVIIGAVWFFVARDTAPKQIRKDLKIVAFGDSLVTGNGSTNGNDFVSVVSKDLGIFIINAGVPGNTTMDGLARLETDVLSQKPDVVIVLLGGNDALRQVPEVQTFENLSKMIDQIQRAGAKVLLLGVRGGIFGDRYKENFDRLAKEKKLVYEPNILNGIFGHSNLMSDGIHPNDKGYKIIAERVGTELRKLITKK